MIATAHATSSPAAASAHALACRPLELLEARQQRDELESLLRAEQAAMADFLVALADFDRRRGWEPLGHANLFAFLRVELGLSPAPTFWRQEAARLLQRFPHLVAPLRRGELCLTTMAELAKVLTEVNRESVLPRFLGISSREAKEIVAELQPRAAPATRTLMRRPPEAAVVPTDGAVAGSEASAVATSQTSLLEAASSQPSLASPAPSGAPPSQLWAPKVDFGGGASTVARRDEIEPLTADRSRLHVSVSRQFTRKLDAARQGLGHSIPNATVEQALEAALDLLLEKQARSRGQVKRPRKATAISTSTSSQASTELQPPPAPRSRHRRTRPREHIPADVRRAVWERDGSRCVWPLDGGGLCGSTHRVEIDHSAVPWARGGQHDLANLRLLCERHNKLAARLAYGERWMGKYARQGVR